MARRHIMESTFRLNLLNPQHAKINEVIKGLNPKIYKSKNQFLIEACEFYIDHYGEDDIPSKEEKRYEQFVTRDEIEKIKKEIEYSAMSEANAIVDTMSATIMKQRNPGLTDPQLRQLIAAHIDDDSFCRYIIQQDINGIALDLREAHRDDFFSVPEDNPLKGLLQAADEAASPDSDPEKASLMFICKRLRLNYGKLSGEDKAALKRLAGKSDLLKNPIPQRGRK